MRILTTADHDRDSAGLTYVYPVVSRRAGGLSIGINLNTNNACNWRCVYCQVPDLRRGGAPSVDLHRLRAELEVFLKDVVSGDFMERHVPEGSRRLNDIALSGNGESTSAREFSEVIDVIRDARQSASIPEQVKTVLITNGSLVHQPDVREGLRRLKQISGEVWFKLDSATKEGLRAINDSPIGLVHVARNLAIAASTCSTWVQTCVFATDGQPPSESEQVAYLSFLREQLTAGVPLKGVLLYGLARVSHQPEASQLSALPVSWLDDYAERIRALGLTVRVAP